MTEQTKLPEPVQVGLWYETKAGAIVKITHQDGAFRGNNFKWYKSYGESWSDNHDLIRCLGADPFKQEVSTHINNIENKDLNLNSCQKAALWAHSTTTQFERIFTAVLPIIVADSHVNDYMCDDVAKTIRWTQEAIKQLKEIEGA